jgi:hypothetical protein
MNVKKGRAHKQRNQIIRALELAKSKADVLSMSTSSEETTAATANKTMRKESTKKRVFTHTIEKVDGKVHFAVG